MKTFVRLLLVVIGAFALNVSAATQKAGRGEPGVDECLRLGDKFMAEGNELYAVYWYATAEERGSAAAGVKKRVAQRALADACAEPSPAVIDNGICRAACAVKFTGWLAEANDRLLARYAAESRFSIADAGKLSSEERHCLACELAAIGNDVGLAYMNRRQLVDWSDMRHGGVVHCAEAVGQKQLAKWIVDVWGVKNGKVSCGRPDGK